MPELVVQEETTGCEITSVANILGKTYSEMKAIANAMGIQASDKLLWSDTQYVRCMLSSAGVETSKDDVPFESWEALIWRCYPSNIIRKKARISGTGLCLSA